MKIEISPQNIEQPLVLPNGNNELYAAIASLAFGGAEYIVLDWAKRIYPKWRVRLVVLHDCEKEWTVPSFVHLTRLHGVRLPDQLRAIGKIIAKSGNPVCLCHLLRKKERDVLSENGACVVPVLHNAKAGWLEDATCLSEAPYTIAVSDACGRDLKNSGWEKSVSIIRHIPSPKKSSPKNREQFRKAWNIPQNATVIGMIGAVKLQKNYPFALRVLKKFLEKRDAYLVIVGGPVHTSAGRACWEAVVREIYASGLRNRVAMPGFIPDAASCFPAFDAMLNTSKYEGLSIATLEALMSGLAVVASKVGGQGEIEDDGLILMSESATEDDWVSSLERALSLKTRKPCWRDFPAYRLWTLASLARPVKQKRKILFVTANLNSGGAQRSLVNLAGALKRKIKFEIVVTGNSTASYFFRKLKQLGVRVSRTADSQDAFDHAEMLVKKICSDGISTVCFWNLDPKIKLLLVKTLGFTQMRFMDVSPGNYSFDEMADAVDFQRMICFSEKEYCRRLDKLVLKYNGFIPSGCEEKTMVIPNGILAPGKIKTDYAIHGAPRVAVNGRIAPTKFIEEIIEAMRILRDKIPAAELHVFGTAEPRHRGYMEKIYQMSQDEIDKRVFFHGPDFDVISRLPEFDAFVVLGKNQGCPNALLEALSVGVPAIANDDGGTSEQIIHEQTGFLIKNISAGDLSEALFEVLTDRAIARRLGEAGRKYVGESFSIGQMAGNYIRLFSEDRPKQKSWRTIFSDSWRNIFCHKNKKEVSYGF